VHRSGERSGSMGNDVKIQIETYAQVLLRALQSKDLDLILEGVIYRALRVLLQLNFNHVSLSYDPRACNNLAHSIAAYGARQQNSGLHWSESLPDDVRVMTSKFVEPLIEGIGFSIPKK
jgi:hypothetical protein